MDRKSDAHLQILIESLLKYDVQWLFRNTAVVCAAKAVASLALCLCVCAFEAAAFVVNSCVDFYY